MPTFESDRLIREEVTTGVLCPHTALVLLVGSHARGDAGPYSDVDIIRVLVSPPE